MRLVGDLLSPPYPPTRTLLHPLPQQAQVRRAFRTAAARLRGEAVCATVDAEPLGQTPSPPWQCPGSAPAPPRGSAHSREEGRGQATGRSAMASAGRADRRQSRRRFCLWHQSGRAAPRAARLLRCAAPGAPRPRRARQGGQPTLPAARAADGRYSRRGPRARRACRRVSE
jgi:hypothetical protein